MYFPVPLHMVTKFFQWPVGSWSNPPAPCTQPNKQINTITVWPWESTMTSVITAIRWEEGEEMRVKEKREVRGRGIYRTGDRHCSITTAIIHQRPRLAQTKSSRNHPPDCLFPQMPAELYHMHKCMYESDILHIQMSIYTSVHRVSGLGHTGIDRNSTKFVSSVQGCVIDMCLSLATTVVNE